MKPKHEKARLQVEVVAALDDNDAVQEYWWAVIPSRVYLDNPGKSKKQVTVTWSLNGKKLKKNEGLDINWDGPVEMNKDGLKGDVWDDAWGKPAFTTNNPKKNSVCTLTLKPGTPPAAGTYKYTVFLKINGTRVVIDPEVEFEPEA